VGRALAGLGRGLVVFGLLLLASVAYELWGTGIWTARAQTRLKHEFAREDARLHAGPSVTSTTTRRRATTPTSIDPRLFAPPAEGASIGSIDIPSIGLHGWSVIQGDTQDDLAQGPGHDITTVMPGQLGNVFIAGHRTTHGASFGDIDKIKAGDDIILTTHAGTFRYRMFGEHLIVKPRDVWVMAPTADAELTLAACHPKGWATHRIVVKARLVVDGQQPKPVPPASVPTTVVGRGKTRLLPGEPAEGSIDGNGQPIAPTFVWGFLVALVGAAWWWAFRRWRQLATWFAGFLPFIAVLFVFYTYVERVLPSGY